jgi:alpha-beta hydrolase superfamily lysophospholipase
MFQHYTEETYLNRARDLKLFYRMWVPPEPKALILFIHGAGEHSGAYAHIAAECLQRRIAFAAPDLRGFGRSEGKRGYVRHFGEYLDDLDELIGLLYTRYPELPIFLFGNSLGGLVAIRYVQQYCNKVTGVILSAPALGIGVKLPGFLQKLIELVSLLAPEWPVEFIKWNGMLRKLKWLQAHLPEWTADMFDDPLATIRYTPRWFTELLRNGTKALSEGDRFQSPLLCIYDRYDTVVNAKRIERFVDSVASGEKACSVYDRGGHQLLHDGEVLRHVFQWLEMRCLRPDCVRGP